MVDFTDLDGSVTELGRFLAEEFSTAIADTGKGFSERNLEQMRQLYLTYSISQKSSAEFQKLKITF